MSCRDTCPLVLGELLANSYAATLLDTAEMSYAEVVVDNVAVKPEPAEVSDEGRDDVVASIIIGSMRAVTEQRALENVRTWVKQIARGEAIVEQLVELCGDQGSIESRRLGILGTKQTICRAKAERKNVALLRRIYTPEPAMLEDNGK